MMAGAMLRAREKLVGAGRNPRGDVVDAGRYLCVDAVTRGWEREGLMRIGKVMGRVTLTQPYETLVGGRFLLVAVLDRFALKGGVGKTNEVVVVYDHLGAGDGEVIAFTESREATMPFYPEKRVPIDAYNAAILDRVTIEFELA